MIQNLSKSQKKIVQRVMDKGMDNHFKQGLERAEEIIKKWKNNEMKNQEAYMTLLEKLKSLSKHMSRLYDGKGSSHWTNIMAVQLADGVISTQDIMELDPEIRDEIIKFSGTLQNED